MSRRLLHLLYFSPLAFIVLTMMAGMVYSVYLLAWPLTAPSALSDVGFYYGLVSWWFASSLPVGMVLGRMMKGN